MALDASRHARDQQASAVRERLNGLTAREREVMRAILAGKMNKVIADELHIAMRTVEVHRAHIFVKMGVKSAVELSSLLAEMQVTP
jgi:two-component system response regulator DctR